MKLGSLFAALLAGLAITGCADTSTASSDDNPSPDHSSTITMAPPSNPDNPPPTLSGYVDSSYTEQAR